MKKIFFICFLLVSCKTSNPVYKNILRIADSKQDQVIEFESDQLFDGSYNKVVIFNGYENRYFDHYLKKLGEKKTHDYQFWLILKDDSLVNYYKIKYNYVGPMTLEINFEDQSYFEIKPKMKLFINKTYDSVDGENTRKNTIYDLSKEKPSQEWMVEEMGSDN